MDVRIRNSFNETDYVGYESQNLAEYTELQEKLKQEVLRTVGDDIIDIMSGSDVEFRSYSSNFGEGDMVSFICWKSNNNEAGEIMPTHLAVDIKHLSVWAGNSSALETENHLSAPETLHFVAY